MIFGFVSILVVIIGIGVALYLFGVNALFGLVTDNALFCLFALIVLVGLVFILHLIRTVWFKQPF